MTTKLEVTLESKMSTSKRVEERVVGGRGSPAWALATAPVECGEKVDTAAAESGKGRE